MSDTLTELTITSFSKAQIITTRLEVSGIECFLKNVSIEHPNLGSGIKILVAEKDLEKANRIIKELISEMAPEAPPSPNFEALGGLFIIPVDFTQASLNACYYALELANRFKSRLKLIHTYGIPEIRPMSFDDTDFYTGTLTTHLNELRQEAESKVSELTQLLKQYCLKNSLGDIPITFSVVNGLPDEITIYTAEAEIGGLIIMGVSRKDIRTFEPVGKIATRIVEKASCPVLIVPEDSSINEIPQANNVLYTTAFDELDFAAIQKLIGVVKQLKSKIFILHIGNEEGDPWDNIKMEGLREYFAKAYSYTDVFCNLIYSDDILNVLDDFIKKYSIGIISMVTHKRNLIWKLISPSLTKKVLYHTKIPLLVFHS
jgi:nucleotide-binding universal stress UspA family protein